VALRYRDGRVPPAPFGERLRHQRPQAGGIGESSTDIAVKFPAELGEFLLVTLNLPANAPRVYFRDQPVVFLLFGVPLVPRIYKKRDDFLSRDIPRVFAFEPGNAFKVNIRRIVGYPAIAVRQDYHHDFGVRNHIETNRQRRLVPAGGEVLHHARRKAAGARGPGSLFAVVLQVVRGGRDKHDRVVGHGFANSNAPPAP